MKRHEFSVRKGIKSKFYNAVRKYGWENFVYGIVGEFDYLLLNEKEIYYIDFYNTYHNGYNMTFGGDGNNIPSKLCIIKAIEANTGKALSEEHKNRISEANLGKPKHTEESKKKLREANLGKKYDSETIRKRLEARKGKKRPPHSQETKEKLSKAHKGKTHSEETKRKMCELRKGKKWWNDGCGNCKMMIECPGDGWVPGRK